MDRGYVFVQLGLQPSKAKKDVAEHSDRQREPHVGYIKVCIFAPFAACTFLALLLLMCMLVCKQTVHVTPVLLLRPCMWAVM